eukprot:g1921.t1
MSSKNNQVDQQDEPLTDDAIVTSWLYGKAQTTQRGYRARFAEFQFYCRRRHLKLLKIKLHNVQSFLTKQEKKGIMPRPIAAIIKSFYRFCAQNGHIASNPVDALRLGRQPAPKVSRKLSKQEIRKIITASKTFKKKGTSHYMLVSLAIFSGLRRAELAALTTDNVCQHHNGSVSVFVRSGKGSKQRRVVLPEKFGKEILAFAGAKGPAVSLFQATAQTIANRWKAVCQKAHLPQCSTHWARHAYTTLSLAGDGDSRPSLVAVSRSLGHASVSTTGAYMHSLETRAPSAFINLEDSDHDEQAGAQAKPVKNKKAKKAKKTKKAKAERVKAALARLA